MRVGSIEAMRQDYQPGEDGSNPIPTLQFDATWRKECRVHPCNREGIDSFIKQHYIGKWPGVVVLILRMTYKGRKCGGIVFALPPRETAKRYGGVTWELARLWIEDRVPSNAETWLIAQAVRHIRKTRPEVKTLVSYADPSVGHKGTIYKAANWKADGRTDDERKTPRFDYADAATGKKYSRRGHVPEGVTIKRVPRVSKYRFVFQLDRTQPGVSDVPVSSKLPTTAPGPSAQHRNGHANYCRCPRCVKRSDLPYDDCESGCDGDPSYAHSACCPSRSTPSGGDKP